MTHVLDLLSAHLDGELTPDERDRVASHLAACPLCTSELREMSEVRDAVRSLPVVEPPIPLLPAARRARRWLSAAASIAAGALVAGLAVGPGEPVSAFDLDTLAGQHTTRAAVDPGSSAVRGPVGSP